MARRRSSNNSKKSSSKKRYGIELLPEELMFKIFTLLSVITLLRCKSVCKSWLSIILNPKFIETHLIESQKRQPLSILKLWVNQLSISTDHKTSNRLQLPEHFSVMTSGFVSCCNGLVCLANSKCDVIYLWNPMIRKFKMLPTPKAKNDKPGCFCFFMLGFGYDGFCNDYKIVRIVLYTKYAGYKTEPCDFVYTVHVEMYSANEDSWKEIEIPESIKFFKFYPSAELGVFVPQTHGVLYFEGFYELLSFDLHDELFRVYPYHIPGKYPLYDERNEPRMSKLLDFEGSLAMIYAESIDDGESFYSLWTFDVDCGNVSWTKQFNIEKSLENDDRVTLYLGDGQFFVVKKNYFGPGTNNYYYSRKLAKKFLPPPGSFVYRVAKYSESLVSLKGFEQY